MHWCELKHEPGALCRSACCQCLPCRGAPVCQEGWHMCHCCHCPRKVHPESHWDRPDSWAWGSRAWLTLEPGLPRPSSGAGGAQSGIRCFGSDAESTGGSHRSVGAHSCIPQPAHSQQSLMAPHLQLQGWIINICGTRATHDTAEEQAALKPQGGPSCWELLHLLAHFTRSIHVPFRHQCTCGVKTLSKTKLGQILSFYKSHLCVTSSGNLHRFFKKLLYLINEGQNTRQTLHSYVQCQNNFLILVYQNPQSVSSLRQHSQHPKG